MHGRLPPGDASPHRRPNLPKQGAHRGPHGLDTHTPPAMSSSSASPSDDGAVGPAAKRARREAVAGAPPAIAEEQPPAWAVSLQCLPAQMQQMQAQMQQMQGQLQAQMQQMQAQMQAQVQTQIVASRAAVQAQIESLSAQVTAQSVAQTALGAALAARVDSMESTMEAGHAAMGGPFRERVQLAKRALLSPAEEVLGIPYLSQRSVMSFLFQEDVLGLRAASRACCDAIAEHAWNDWAPNKSIITGSLLLYRRCFRLRPQPTRRATIMCRTPTWCICVVHTRLAS